MSRKKWFSPKRESGFKKDKGVKANVETMLRKAPKNWGRERKLLLVGRQAQALENVTQDRPTRRKADKVAKEAFKRLKKLKE